jgi:hypothetical protein
LRVSRHLCEIVVSTTTTADHITACRPFRTGALLPLVHRPLTT